MEKYKILMISDHALSPSGVGTQSRFLAHGLIEKGCWTIRQLGGALKHDSYEMVKAAEDFLIKPVDGFGTVEMIRSLLVSEKPDIVLLFTDPRFFVWLWQIEDEIHQVCPIAYWHVWDNWPRPNFNDNYYESTDLINCHSYLTYEIVKEKWPERANFVPHALPEDVFYKISDAKIKLARRDLLGKDKENDFIMFWINRNAKRKRPADVLFSWKKFLDKIEEVEGRKPATLVMHTDVNDQHGQPLEFLASHLGLDKGQVQFSKDKLTPENLSKFYQMADCTINIADAEGFGLATLESLSCGTPIMVTMTGGLQEQVTDGKNWFGVGIEPTSKAVVGSGQVPFIYEDRINQEVFVSSLKKIYDMDPKEREKLGAAGRKHIEKNYNFKDFEKKWVDFMLGVHEYSGSWETRKNYKSWELINL